MGSDIPKQFLPLHGKPLLMHTLTTFHTFDPTLHLILVLPKAQQSYWRELCFQQDFTIHHMVADGGETRFHSVQNGLACIEADDALVAVHDGVRPFVAHTVIADCFTAAEQRGAAIPVQPVVETIRQLDGQNSTTVDRTLYRLVQTPQTFRLNILRDAYTQPYDSRFTDDASVVEAAGQSVTLVDGNRENIKITTPFDLRMAEMLCGEGS
jgi:2-C-methyl-D-erythritol 4-phosphate cytidylyltransferase